MNVQLFVGLFIPPPPSLFVLLDIYRGWQTGGRRRADESQAKCGCVINSPVWMVTEGYSPSS